MHISSYIVAHMMYQALLCLVQTALTVYTCKMMGIQFPEKGLFTNWMVVDIGITVFLISYSADMISLWISTLVHNTTTVMSIMPFILIAQLVFSGGIFTLPAWTDGISGFMISHYGVRCIAAQADYNNRPTITAWNTLVKMENNEIEDTMTVGEILDKLSDEKNPYKEVTDEFTGGPYALMVDRDKEVTVRFQIKDVIDLVGRDELKHYLQYKTAEVAVNNGYECSKTNIGSMWAAFVLFIIIFSSLSIISLEFIDKDKR